jgi:thioredoxin 1
MIARATTTLLTILVLSLSAVAEQDETPRDSSNAIADRILKSKVPVLVDFWAVWCKPCHLLAPTIKQIEKEYGDKIMVVRVNIDIHRRMANYFRVSSIPTVFIVKDKAVVKYVPGVQGKQVYRDALDAVLTPAPDPEGDSTETPDEEVEEG